MIVWPTELINDIAKRKCVLYLGSGVSANAKSTTGRHPATWKTFLESICNTSPRIQDKDLILSLIDKEDYLVACELIVDMLGEHEFGEFTANEFRRPGYLAAEIHRAIFSLDSRLVITPNIDKIYDQYANNESHGTIVTKTYYDDDIAKYLRSPDYLVIKAHGTIDTTEKMIFTHKQYARARYTNASFYRILDALMLTHTFIFIGCGISDPDIQLVLETYNFSFPHCRPHFFITAQENFALRISNSLKQNRNIEVLAYENADGSHSQLVDSISELCKDVDIARAQIALSSKW